MASYNRVMLVGNLTRDVEVRQIPSGSTVADIGLAINDRHKSSTGEWVENATFVDVTLWGRTAEIAGEYLSKGSPLLVEGRLKLDRWEQDGQKKSKLKVVGERIQLLGGRGSSERSPETSAAAATSYSEPVTAATATTAVVGHENPF